MPSCSPATAIPRSRLLADPSHSEQRLLSAVRYQPNRVVLHTDAALLPRARRAWSAWNYLAADDAAGERPVAVSYLINKLQPLPCTTPVIVTLNPPFEPDPARVLQEFEYSHPLLDRAAVAAAGGTSQLPGQRNTWYAGAWLGMASTKTVSPRRMPLPTASRSAPRRPDGCRPSCPSPPEQR